jgi:tRNA pseudouridine38-40 synthase
MRTLKLTLAYDGTSYGGWQRQDNAPTVQGVLERALAEIEGRAVTAHGAGRTDAGVHALGQVVSLRLEHPIEPPRLARALNAKLPVDVRVIDAELVPDDFHARYAARHKTYRYWVDTAPVASPFGARFAWHLPHVLNLSAMIRAGAHLCGSHDFSAFQTAGDNGRSTTRVIHDLTVSAGLADWPGPTGMAPGAAVMIEVVGDGFLRHMVRTIAGTLVEVGRNRREADELVDVLESRRRDRAGPTAPSHGLFLVSVAYEASVRRS